MKGGRGTRAACTVAARTWAHTCWGPLRGGSAADGQPPACTLCQVCTIQTIRLTAAITNRGSSSSSSNTSTTATTTGMRQPHSHLAGL